MVANPTIIQFFEWNSTGGGVHWDHLRDEAPRLAKMGITGVWIPPPNKAANPEDQGYQSYDLWDWGEFEQRGAVRTRWGTRAQLEAAIKACKEHGMAVYIDTILGHKGGADGTEKFKARAVDSEDRTEFISDFKEIEGWTKFDFPGRKGKYSSMTWNHNHFNGVDMDKSTGDKSVYLIDGHSWAEDVDKKFGNYDFLLMANIDQRNPEVRKDFMDWAVWSVKEFGIDGFRFDAVRHTDRIFVQELLQHVRKEVDKPIFAVGEYWTSGSETTEPLEAYLDAFDGEIQLFDAPLHWKFKELVDARAAFDLRQIFDDTLVFNRPKETVTIVNNHDVIPGQIMESWITPDVQPLCNALILLRDGGLPCVFYGDLYGLKGPPQGGPPMKGLEKLILARKVLAHGSQTDYFDDPGCIGWVRSGNDEHDGCVVLVSNAEGEIRSKKVDVGKEHAKETWVDVLGKVEKNVTIDDNGAGVFDCLGMDVSIWVCEKAKGIQEFFDF